MANAIVAVQVVHGPTGSPSYGAASGGVVWNRADDELAAKPIPIPTSAPASVYSNYKTFRLVVVTPGTTTLSNFGVRRLGAEVAGSRLFYGAAGTYAHCTGDGDTQGNRPADSTSALTASPAPNTPSSYAPIPLSVVTFDSASYSSASAAPVGDALPVACGVSSGYGGPGESAAEQVSLVFRYSES